MFSVHTTQRNLKTEVSLWKRIKCSPSTPPRRIWKRRFHSENASNGFRPHHPEEFENGGFTLKTHQMFSVYTTQRNLKTELSLWKRIKWFPSILCPRILKTEVLLWKRIKCSPPTPPRGIWKRRFHSENESNVLRPHHPEEFENGGFTLKTHQMFSVRSTSEEFENGAFTLKANQMFSGYTTQRNLKTEVSVWKRIKRLLHYAGEILKT